MRTSSLLIISLTLALSSRLATAAEIPVSTSAAFLSALGTAQGGDVIRLAAGTYAFNDKIRLNRSFTPTTPVTITTSGAVGTVVFDVDNTEGFYVAGTDWIVEKVWVRCTAGANCEDAAGFSIKESARRITIRGCRTTDWYQHFKASLPGDGSGAGAEDVTIQGCESFNTATFGGNTNAINLDGGKRWKVIGNYVHDFHNSGISYGIYFKGGTTDSIMEKNLVVCDSDRASTATAIGMSFGGGRMAVQFCAPDNRGTGGCKCEDTGGIARNNIIIRCNDAGFHTNSACGSKIFNNLIYATSPGLQIQSMQAGVTPIELRNNVISDSVPTNATQITASNNLVNQSDTLINGYYTDVGHVNLTAGANSQTLSGAQVLAEVTDDYCGTPRGTTPYRGPIEFPARCATWPWLGNAMAAMDAGVPTTDAGNPTDAGTTPTDAGTRTDAGTGGTSDGGVIDPDPQQPISCSCNSAAGPALALLVWALRRRRR